MQVKELSFFLKIAYLKAYKFPLRTQLVLTPYTALSRVDVMSNSESEMWWLRRLNRLTVLSCSGNDPEWMLVWNTSLETLHSTCSVKPSSRRSDSCDVVMASFTPCQERASSLHVELWSKRSHRTWHSGWWQRTQKNSSLALPEMLQRSHVRWGPGHWGRWGPDPGILLTCLRDTCCSNFLHVTACFLTLSIVCQNEIEWWWSSSHDFQ